MVSLIKNDSSLGVLAGGGEPLMLLITGHHGKTILYSPGIDLASIEASGVEWLIITGLAPDKHSATIRAVNESDGWEKIGSAEYQTELRRGYKTWFLYRRKPVKR